MPLIRVTLVPVDSKFPNVGPFDCLEGWAFPQYFAYIRPNGDAEHHDMHDTPYVAHSEPLPEVGLFVLYHPEPHADGTRRPDCKALVQAVNEDGTLQLWVFGPLQVYMPNPASEGTAPFQWSPLP